ncbi:DHHC-type zinc finger family protein [Wolffia australiana]
MIRRPEERRGKSPGMGEMGEKLRRFLSLPVIAVISLMSFVHYSTVFIFVDCWFGLRSIAGICNALSFSFLALMCVGSFCASVLIDPGQVPASFVPDVEGSDGHGGRLKFCGKCRIYKPPRAHHCRICKRCVLKMDHHCLWINNCVGYANYKTFIVFVFYATTSAIYAMVIFMGNALQNGRSFIGKDSFKLFSVGFGSTIIILSVLLGTLLGWHIFLLLHNMTTIEYREGIRAIWLAGKSGQRYHHPFDLGRHKNLSSILGSNAFKWCCPLALGHLRDGTQFPTCREVMS